MNWESFQKVVTPQIPTVDWKQCQHLVVVEGILYEEFIKYLISCNYYWIAMKEGNKDECPGGLKSRF